MKKVLCNLMNKLANVYGSMASNASIALCVGQTKAPASLIKKD